MGNKINKEIADIAPTLASLEKHNPFLVPDGYFDSLENRIFDSLDKKPVLDNALPDGYFDNLSDKVLERIKSEEKETRVVPLYRRKWLSIAASFILLLGAGYLISTQSDSINPNTEFALDVDLDEALEYLEENEDLYLSDLLSLDLSEDDISIEEDEMTDFENTNIEELLDELEPEDLEELL